MTIVTSRIWTTDTAALVGSISIRMLSNIFLGSVMLAPARNKATTTSSNDEMKASSPADTRLGRSNGRVTRVSVRQRPGPGAAGARPRPAAAAEACGRLLERAVEIAQARRHHKGHERQRQNGVGHHQPVPGAD